MPQIANRLSNFPIVWKPFKRFFGEVLILIAIVAIAVTIVLRLWEANFQIPLQYNVKESKFPWANFDVNYFLAYLKNGLEGKWINGIDRLGAPEGLESYSFPFPFFPIAIFGLSKLIALFTGSSLAWNVNSLYILSFFIAAIAAFIVFRIYFNFAISIVLSVLFAFIPYHFETGMIFAEQGMTYGYVIPLSILVALWLAQGDFFDASRIEGQQAVRWKRRKIAIALVITLAIAMSNTYYPFFSALLWIAAGLLAVLNQPRTLKLPSVWMTVYLLLGLGISLLILVSPVILHRWQFPTTTPAFTRNWQDSEFWGLKITQLYLPIRDHYLPLFTEFARRYGPYPYSHVNASAALGLVGTIGFTSLIAAFFLEQLPIKRAYLFRTLAGLNLVAVLFATVAGYGTLFALAVTPEIRALYRIVPYISFLAFFAIGLLLQACFNHLPKLEVSTTRKIVSRGLLLALILILGVADQTGYLAIPQYRAIAKTFSAHATFFGDLESQLPSQAMVFQIPYEQFPEGGKSNASNRWVANESFIPYLHTKMLRWSYGSTRGSSLAEWKKKIAELPAKEMIQNLCPAHFAAILLDYEQFTTKEQPRAMLDDLGHYARLIFEGKEGRYAAFRICESQDESKQR